jgi:hypothetical protein
MSEEVDVRTRVTVTTSVFIFPRRNILSDQALLSEPLFKSRSSYTLSTGIGVSGGLHLI